MKTNSGFLFIDKEEGLTSQRVDSMIKKKFDLPKAGHLGTLDPFATGLLIVATNDATKFMSMIPDADKSYRASLKFGISTDTDDYTGTVLKQEAIPELTEEQIKDVLFSFIGKQKQKVPLYNAKHINGVRSYVLLRQGIEFEPPVIDIEVKDIRFISYVDNTLTFEADVSKGTYIRSLGRDIADKLNTIGNLVALRRTRVGQYSVDEANKISVTNEDSFKTIETMFPEIEVYDCPEELKGPVYYGNKVHLDCTDEKVFIHIDGKLVALYVKEDGDLYRCYRGIKRV